MKGLEADNAELTRQLTITNENMIEANLMIDALYEQLLGFIGKNEIEQRMNEYIAEQKNAPQAG